MPEYLAPGVFVEEVSFRSKSIEGVPTSTTGFAGLTRWGPTCYRGGPTHCEPRLITSFTEFERVYGGLEPIHVGAEGATEERLTFVAHAARAFFDNGGRRLYVSRVFVRRGDENEAQFAALSTADQRSRLGIASSPFQVAATPAAWVARWPGAAGNVLVRVDVVRSQNVAFNPSGNGSPQVRRARAGSVVEIYADGEDLAALNAAPAIARLRVVEVDANGLQSFRDENDVVVPLDAGDRALLLELRVTVNSERDTSDVYDELSTAPDQRRYIGRILQRDDPEDEDALVWLDWTPPGTTFDPAQLILALAADPNPRRLAGGHDGVLAEPLDLRGETTDPDHPNRKATGLEALGEIDDIAIVALPDSGTYGPGDDRNAVAAGELISHAQALRYRIAILDGPEGSSLNAIRAFRGRFDSTYAALYHPWIEVLDPTERPAGGSPPRRLLLPPSGFVAGIFARSDVERGVHKAPANEVVYGLTRFEANINTRRQEVLNPEGINALRFFEGRGNRVWGARTISSDPEWKYVNVRRLFIFIEHSIDQGTQFAVFEPNGPKLWQNVRRAIEDFLLVLWRDGALLGDKPEKAYFVRCDRTTMTQNDLDNGRLICLIGIAPVKPAEFVIFRIGQWTADAAM